MDKVIVEFYNASTQKREPHVVTKDSNGEYILTADDGTFVKYPASMTPEEVMADLDKYEEANKGQIKMDMDEVEAKNKEDLKGFSKFAIEDAEIVE